MIQSFALEFNTEEEMLQTGDKLWNRHNVTGELEMLPLANGKWKLIVHSEKQLREATLEKLAGKRVQIKTSSGKVKDVAEEDDDDDNDIDESNGDNDDDE